MACPFGLTRASQADPGFAQEAIASCPTPILSYNSTLHPLLLRCQRARSFLQSAKYGSLRG